MMPAMWQACSVYARAYRPGRPDLICLQEEAETLPRNVQQMEKGVDPCAGAHGADMLDKVKQDLKQLVKEIDSTQWKYVSVDKLLGM